jgi:hypothetical protein
MLLSAGPWHALHGRHKFRIRRRRSKEKLLPLSTGLVLRLSLLLLCLLVRSVAAVGTTGGGTHDTVTGIVASDTTGDGAFNAPLGVGGEHRAHYECDYHEYRSGVSWYDTSVKRKRSLWRSA